MIPGYGIKKWKRKPVVWHLEHKSDGSDYRNTLVNCAPHTPKTARKDSSSSSLILGIPKRFRKVWQWWVSTAHHWGSSNICLILIGIQNLTMGQVRRKYSESFQINSNRKTDRMLCKQLGAEEDHCSPFPSKKEYLSLKKKSYFYTIQFLYNGTSFMAKFHFRKVYFDHAFGPGTKRTFL